MLVQQFHHYLRKSASLKERKLNGKETVISRLWSLQDNSSMDQTGLEFYFNAEGVINNTLVEKNIGFSPTAGGKNKRKCTVQLTLFVEGVPRVKPFFVILKETVQRITVKEKK